MTDKKILDKFEHGSYHPTVLDYRKERAALEEMVEEGVIHQDLMRWHPPSFTLALQESRE